MRRRSLSGDPAQRQGPYDAVAMGPPSRYPDDPDQLVDAAQGAAGDIHGRVAPVDGSHGPLAVTITGEDWLDAICPFLRAQDGSWRSASPARDHRCWATDPPSELPVLTQQRLCLMRAHDGCERFLHARELRSSALARERPGRDAEGADLAADLAESRVSGPSPGMQRFLDGVGTLPRVVSVGAAAGVAGLIVLGALAAGGGGAPAVSPSPMPVPTESARPGASPSAEASPGAVGPRRYRVREGDTLRTIAERFGVSVRQIRAINDLGDPPRLEPGMVILVPAAG